MSNATEPERPIVLLDTSTAIALVLRDQRTTRLPSRRFGGAPSAWRDTRGSRRTRC